MPRVTFQPSGRVLEVPAGITLWEACRRAGFVLDAPCAGRGLCGRCRVRVAADAHNAPLPPNEPGHPQAEVSPEDAAKGWRVACRTRVQGDLALAEPPARRERILTEFAGREPDADGGLRADRIELPPPSLADQADDARRLARALRALDGVAPDAPAEPLDLPLSVARTLPERLRADGFRVTVTRRGRHILSVRPGEPRAPLGFALDIGTTTLAATLFTLADGRPLAVASAANPQGALGADVMTRIDFARASAEGREEMRRLVAHAAAGLLAETCGRAGAEPGDVALAAVVGNTVMQHLFLGLDPAGLAEVPFAPAWTAAWRSGPDDARTLVPGLADAELLLPPCVSAYVGGDVVAGALAHEVHRFEGVGLFLDVGTNGEMLLRANGETWACATAAGPAFEGARISCGMRAAAGAIFAVGADADNLRLATVDGEAPAGLCGTGLVDAVALLLDWGLVDETGRMLDAAEAATDAPATPAWARTRLFEHADGSPAFRLAEDADGRTLALTQRDVREFQLAKAAIAAGANVLLAHAGLPADRLERVWLAGGFGHAINPISARRTGLLPAAVPPDRIRAVGNAALAGAWLYALAEKHRAEADRIARETRYLELSGRADFQEAFADAMAF